MRISNPISPMLAVLSTMPQNEKDYGFEFKWDGIRAICYRQGGKLRIESRNQIDITNRYPEFEPLKRIAGKKDFILDGEIIAVDEKGRPSFSLLQKRMGQTSPVLQKSLMKTVPATYMIFDVLLAGKTATASLPYKERRRVLESLGLEGPAWKVPPSETGGGKKMYAVAEKHGLEGLIAKKLDSIYEIGRRSEAWRKIKIIRSQEFVVGGWLPGEGSIQNSIGSILLGYYENGRLKYAGNVGTGFSLHDRIRLLALLEKIKLPRSAFDGLVDSPGKPLFCTPRYVAEIEYRGWTLSKKIRQGSFKGLRQDKAPEEIVREIPKE